MPIPKARDLDEARRRLASWLSTKVSHSGGVELSEITGPAATGYSNETLMFDARWTHNGREREESYVARVKPTSHSVFLESEFENQYLVMKALRGHTSVPMPRIDWYEEDPDLLGAPFYVMEKIAGEVPADTPPYTIEGFVKEASPADQRRMYMSGLRAMRAVHDADWQELGLQSLDKTSRGRTGLDQQLSYYEDTLVWASAGRPQPVAEAAWEWLAKNRPVEEGPVGLCWGDSRLGNLMFRDFEVQAVLDWEMVTLGPPEEDLAWWLFLDRHWSDGIGIPFLPGFPTREETVSWYATELGRPLENLVYWEVFAGLRFACVMMRLAQMLVDYELLPSDSDLEWNNIPTQLLAGMLDLEPPGPPLYV
jgi:aminoglycoside phosphotransferase (APT) family kinase protein